MSQNQVVLHLTITTAISQKFLHSKERDSARNSMTIHFTCQDTPTKLKKLMQNHLIVKKNTIAPRNTSIHQILEKRRALTSLMEVEEATRATEDTRKSQVAKMMIAVKRRKKVAAAKRKVVALADIRREVIDLIGIKFSLGFFIN